MTDPTTGGVSASIAMLGDIILVEPGALVGFAGPRVIQQTIKQDLPEGFQRAEFLLQHGVIDRIVHRKNLRSEISKILSYLAPLITSPLTRPGKVTLKKLPIQVNKKACLKGIIKPNNLSKIHHLKFCKNIANKRIGNTKKAKNCLFSKIIFV